VGLSHPLPDFFASSASFAVNGFVFPITCDDGDVGDVGSKPRGATIAAPQTVILKSGRPCRE
jgi:hypothetical protein